jgi:hypothetical protein
MEVISWSIKVYHVLSRRFPAERASELEQATKKILPNLSPVIKKFCTTMALEESAAQKIGVAPQFERQAKLIEAMRAKQQAFTQQVPVVEVSAEPETDSCSICKGPSTAKRRLVVPAEVKTGNALLKANGAPNGSIGYKHLITCGHPAHVDCWMKHQKEYVSQMLNMDCVRGSLFLQKGEAACPVCRERSRFFLHVDEEDENHYLGEVEKYYEHSDAFKAEFAWIKKYAEWKLFAFDIAEFAYMDLLTVMALNPEKCIELTEEGVKKSKSVFVRLIRRIGHIGPYNFKPSAEMASLDPKFLLIFGSLFEENHLLYLCNMAASSSSFPMSRIIR